MPMVNVKVNITDKDRAAFAHRIGRKGATLSDLVHHLRQVCYEVLGDYEYEYEYDLNIEQENN